MRWLGIFGSPRGKGNSTLLGRQVLAGAAAAGAEVEEVLAGELNLDFCQGCLRCNLLKRCALDKDDWPGLSRKIAGADGLVIASPIYFHHVSASLKKVIDRFRSFLQVRITPDHLFHAPWQPWKKKWILVLTLGHPSIEDAQPVLDLFKFICGVLGPENQLTPIVGTRLAVAGQVAMNAEELLKLYGKLGLPKELASADLQRNQQLWTSCYDLGKKITIQA